MKDKVLLAGLAALLAVSLTGCMQADSGNGAAAGGSSSSGTGTIVAAGGAGGGAGAADPAGEQDGAGVSGSDTGDTLYGGAQDNGVQNSGAIAGPLSTEPSGSPQTEAAGQGSAQDGLPDAQDEDETDPVTENGADEGWSGTYVSESGETLTVSINDISSITFAFTNAGISGTAKLDGSQAIYYGDDHHQAVFEYSGGNITVEVVSEEDFDTSGSPLNGVYARQ